MGNRVLIGANGVKVSKSGVNVLTAPVSQLNFNSDFAAMGIFRTDEYTIVFPGSRGFFNRSISLGRTFPSPPFISFDRRVGSNYYNIGSLSGFSYYYRQESTGSQGYREMEITASVGTSDISIRGYWDTGVSSVPPPPNFIFRWSAYEYNL